MHKSQFGGLIIDCQTHDLETAASFWSEALGLNITPDPENSDPLYSALETRPEDPYLEVQKVSHESRVHLDIETDNIEAEVKRLEKLGAKRVSPVKSWVVMEAPTGQRFCVVNAERANFQQTAKSWE